MNADALRYADIDPTPEPAREPGPAPQPERLPGAPRPEPARRPNPAPEPIRDPLPDVTPDAPEKIIT